MGDKLSSVRYNEVKNTTWLPSCHSTNSYANSYLKEGELPDGWIFFTFHQTAGRGQAGNKWESEPDKNLTFSKILIHPDILIKEQFFLNMVVSLSIHAFLESLGIGAMIKWPNDIYIGRKKIAGILIENCLRDNKIRHSIIGIGLNVNQTVFANHNATSMQLITNKEYDLLETLNGLNNTLEKHIETLKTAPDQIVKKYHEHLYQRGIRCKYVFNLNDQMFEGVIQGVDILGRLVIQTSGGKKVFDLKEIRFL